MRRPFVALFVTLVVLGAVPGTAVGATETGDVVIVEEGETVNDLTAIAGTVIVRGTVNGDLAAIAGNVHVAGTVNGDVEAMAGNVRITGSVVGGVTVFGGNVHVGESGTIGRTFDAAAGEVEINGTVQGDATIGAGRISLGPTALITGNLEYNSGSLERHPESRVTGSIERVESADVAGGPLVPNWLTSLYGFLTTLLLGVILLLAFPRFSRRVATRVADDPLTSGGVGLVALVVGPILLVLLAITIIGIPLALLGAFLFAFLVWVGSVYGIYSVGEWLLSLADVDNRWVALLFGLLLLALLSPIPLVGGVVQFLLLLLGLGALLLTLRNWR